MHANRALSHSGTRRFGARVVPVRGAGGSVIAGNPGGNNLDAAALDGYIHLHVMDAEASGKREHREREHRHRRHQRHKRRAAADAVRPHDGQRHHAGPDDGTPSEAERIQASVTIAKHAEEVGLDVFALGEHHNPPFWSSSPTTTLAYIAAQTERLIVSTSTTLITTNDPVKIAEDYAMLQHLSGGRMDLMMGRGNTGPVYPWFGKDIRQGLPLAIENYAAAQAVARGRRRLGGQVPHAAAGLHRDPRPSTASRRSSGTARSARPRSPSRPPTTATASSRTTSSGPPSTTSASSVCTASAGSTTATAPETAIVGLGGQAFMAKNSQDAVKQFRPYFDNAPVYGHGPSMEDFTEMTPLTVGSPQQVIDRYAGMRDLFGDYQRQLFLMDHAACR
jgi:alkanesulfonate monooxygenase SsuD/methylene tetrahydromethanopterin reductase-like flavin-dependent oxidoreductase (luciferase family)